MTQISTFSFSASLLLCSLFTFCEAAQAAELLMVEETDCVYCSKFNREIAPAYSNTTEGKRAPLRRLQLNSLWPDTFKSIKRATVTPTFILVENEVEIDRLVGYPGDVYFWFLLNQMLDKL